MRSSFITVLPHSYTLANGKNITIRNLGHGSASKMEWSKVRERLLADRANLIPDVMRIATDSASSVIIVAINNEKKSDYNVLGFVVLNIEFMHEGIAVITWISVLNRFRGLHIGRSLLQYVENCCRANKLRLIEVFSTDGYTRLFRRQGFHKSHNPRVFVKGMQKKVKIYEVPPVPYIITSGEASIRYATKEDRKQWTFCLLEACGYNFGGCDFLRRVLEAEFRITVLHNKDNRVIGVFSMDATGWIPFISCIKEYRGKGIGSFLLFLGMEWYRLRGGDCVSLSPLDKGVIDFYKRWAFYEENINSNGRKRPRNSEATIILTRTISQTESYLPEGKSLEDFIMPTIKQSTENIKCEAMEESRNAPGTSLENIVNNSLENGMVTPLKNTAGTSFENAVDTFLENSVAAPLENSVGNSFENAVDDFLENSVAAPLENSIRNSFENAVDTFLENSLGAPLENSVGNSFENAVDDFLENSVAAPLENSIRNSFENAVDDFLENSVAAPLENSIRNSFENAVDTFLENSLGAPLENSIGNSFIDVVGASYENALVISSESSEISFLANSVDTISEGSVANSFEGSLDSYFEDSVDAPLEDSVENVFENAVDTSFEDAVIISSQNAVDNFLKHFVSPRLEKTV